MSVTTMIGAKIHRREDPRLITGHGTFSDDLTLPGLAHLYVLRSPHAHARIKSIDVTDAVAAPGVIAVYTSRDFAKVLQGGLPVTTSFITEKKQTPLQPFIAGDEVAYQGEPVVVVLASQRAQAADAANLVQVDYEPLPAVIDLEAAARPGSPTAHSGAADNIAWDSTFAGGDADAAFAAAEVVVKERIRQQRLAHIPIEGRGVMAQFTPFANQLTIWSSTQIPHFVRLFVAGAMGLPETQVRVISGDVGGAFGSKIHPYPEEYLAAAAAKLSGGPVKWIETRTENLQATSHGRDQIFDVEIAAKRDGTMLGLKVTQHLDAGAYVSTFGSFQTVAMLLASGAYDIQSVKCRTVGVLTNKTPTDALRGAGRPEATHALERIVDLLAQQIGMDPAELRRKNFVRKFPHTNYAGLVYDSGDYEKSLDRALELAGYSDLRRQQEALRGQGRYLGIGLSTYIEACGGGPSGATAQLVTGSVGLTESAQVRVHPTGSATITVGTHAHGQSHDTTFAQIAADTLGIPYESIDIRHGDTADSPFGFGTYGSRSLAVGGMAIRVASQKVVEKAKKIAAHVLEAAEDDIEFDQGRFYVKGSPDRAKTMGEIAFAAYVSLPFEMGLEAVTFFDPPNFTWPFGAHLCVVEVDPETGAVDLQKYVAVDDCGNVINPLVVDGQILGGIAHSIAQSLFEEVVYDPESGQLKTGTLLDYLVPTANEMPEFVLDRTVTPSPTNELGVKGIGEAGTIAATAAVINAICDALNPVGIKHVDMPASPDRLWKQIKEARK